MQQLDSHHQPPFYRLLLLTSAVATAQLDKDVDGDGVPNVSDPHPLIMKVPDFTWKVEGMVLTREINREWLKKQTQSVKDKRLDCVSS